MKKTGKEQKIIVIDFELSPKVAHHKFHGHEAINFANHQKHGKSQAVPGKFIIQAHEGIAKVPLKQTKDQAKANGAHQGCQGIETERIAWLPMPSQANKQVNCQVLKEKYEDRNDEEI